MPGTPTLEDIELIIEDIGGGGGALPPTGGDGGGGDGGRGRRPSKPSSRRYYLAIRLAIVSIVMFFLALSGAYLVLKGTGNDWVPIHLPAVLWLNTMMLLASSLTMELARRQLAAQNLAGFRALWRATTALGLLFLAGQLVGWQQLVGAGVYVSTNPASSFFYIFTAAHGLHLLGGIGALLYVLRRNFEKTQLTRATAAQVTSFYWHFMDGLWIFLLTLLYLGK
jgi:cytochrome c oxidase subunit 3